MREVKGAEVKNMGVRTEEDKKENQLQNPNHVSSMMGLGVGDVTLTMQSLFPVAIDSDTYLKNSVLNLNVHSQNKKQKQVTRLRFQNTYRILSLLKKASNKTFESLFWIVFLMLFQQSDQASLKDNLKFIFKEQYGKYFIELSSKERQIILDKIPFVYGHATIKAFFDIFQSSRMTFNKSFGIKVFKLVFFEIQGISISEVFICNNVQKMFTDDLFSFLEIAEGGKPKHKNYVHKDKRQRKMTLKLKTTEEGTQAPPLEIQNTLFKIDGGEEFFEKLNKIYNPKKIEKLLQKKNNLMKMHETLSKKQDEEKDQDEVENATITTDEEESRERLVKADPISVEKVDDQKTTKLEQLKLMSQTQSSLGFYRSNQSAMHASQKQLGHFKSSFRLPLDEDYIVNPPPTSSKHSQRTSYFAENQPKKQKIRQEVFSCTKLSPFMTDLYKFEDVYSKVNVKFNSNNKEIKDTPRGLKQFRLENQIKKTTTNFLAKEIKTSKIEREKLKSQGTTENDTNDNKKHKKFLKNVLDKNSSIVKSNPQLKQVYTLKDQLVSGISDPSRAILFKKQIEERKEQQQYGGQGIVFVKKNQINNFNDEEYKDVEKNIDHEFQEYKYVAVNKNIDSTKYRLSRMGKFGNYLVKDVYGNMNFEKENAIEMPKITNLQQYDEEKKKERDMLRQASTGQFLSELGIKQKKQNTGLNLSKFQLNKTYSMMRRHIYNNSDQKS